MRRSTPIQDPTRPQTDPLGEVAIIGVGRAGLSLAAGLLAEGRRPVLVETKTWRCEEVSIWLAAALPAGQSVAVAPDAARAASCNTVVFAVPDAGIEAAAAEAVAAGLTGNGQVWLHLSGLLSPRILAAKGTQARPGSCHPLAVLIDPVAGPASLAVASRPLRGAFFALAGREPALAAAQALARAVHGRPEALPAAARPRYHAAASLLANDLVALFAAAERSMGSVGLPQPVARRALFHLLDTSVAGLRARSQRTALVWALTGPVARNDPQTLAAHLEALAAEPATAEVHRLLSLLLCQLVVAAGGDRSELIRMLSPEADPAHGPARDPPGAP